jgi:hypothetical protein
VFRTVGAAECCVEGSAMRGLVAAVTAQRGLVTEQWNATGLPAEKPLRVRMALHTGVVESHNGDYRGQQLKRTWSALCGSLGRRRYSARWARYRSCRTIAPNMSASWPGFAPNWTRTSLLHYGWDESPAPAVSSSLSLARRRARWG